jgi:hypothetical protein
VPAGQACPAGLISPVKDESALRKPQLPCWLWLNVLGLDAPLVAIAWQFFFAGAFRLKIPTSNYLVLGLIVWVIYSADRLLDARRLGAPQAASARHRFYRDWFWIMLPLTVIGLLLAVVAVLMVLPEILLHCGAVVFLFVIVYFIHRLWVQGPMLVVVPKEIFSGMVFAIGTTLTGYAWSNDIPDALYSPEVLWFGGLCSLNCMAISVWERNADAGNDGNALPQVWPAVVGFFPVLAWGFTVSGAVFAFLQAESVMFPVFLAVASGGGLLALLASTAERIPPALLRVAADVAVILPALVYLPLLPWDSTV